jgi:uncharacterized protein YjdB
MIMHGTATARRLRRAPRSLRLLAAGLLVLASCTDGDSPVDVDFRRAPALAIRPHFSVLGGQAGTQLSINRIRLVARDSTSGAILGQQVRDEVDPNAASWTLPLDIRMPEAVSSVVVVVGIELIRAAGEVEQVQWSGRSPGIRVTPGSTQAPDVPITLYQGPPANLEVTAVTIEAPASQVVEGDVVELTASASTSIPATPQIFWSSLDPAVAGVGAGGRVTTLRDGTARIVAEAGPRADTVSLTVLQRPHTVAVTPERARVTSLGAEVEFEAAVLDPRGAVIAGAAVMWQPESSPIAEHLGGGRVRARAVGSYALAVAAAADPAVSAMALLEVAQEVASIRVVPGTLSLRGLNASAQLVADPRDANGNPVAGAVVHWSSDNHAVALVSDDGVVSPTGVGRATITASAGAMTAVVAVEVRHEPAKVLLAASAAELTALDATLQATATVAAADGTVLPLPVEWESNDPAVATVDQTGLITARRNGTATISAAHDTLRAALAVTVRQVARTFSAEPAALTLLLGQSAAVAVAAVDSNGHPVAGAIEWSSSAETVAAVSADGTVTAAGAGTAVVTATRDGVSVAVPVTVHAPNLSLGMVALPHGVIAGTPVTGTVTILNTGDAPAPPSSLAVYVLVAGSTVPLHQVVLPLPALASGAELLLPVAIELPMSKALPGEVQIEIVLDPAQEVAESDETDNRVLHGPVTIRFPVHSIGVAPSEITLSHVGATAQITVLLADQFGRAITGLSPQFATRDATVAEVSAEGVVTGTGLGTTQIEVGADGVTATVHVTVQGTPAGIVVLQGNAQTGRVGEVLPQSLRIEVRDAAGRPLAGVAVEWLIGDDTAGGTSEIPGSAAGQAPPAAGALSESLTWTDAAGRTEVTWQLGRRAGLQRSSARVGAADVAFVFDATARAGPPARGRQNGGGLTATVSPDLTDVIEIQLFDAFDNPVPDAEVLWRVQGGGPHSVLPNGQQSATTVTDEAGITQLEWSGFSTTVGLHRLRVSVDGTPVDLLIEKQTRAAAPAHGQKRRGGSDSDLVVSLELTDELELLVTDRFDNPVEGARVRWTVREGNGRFGTAETQETLTDAAGVTSIAWSLGTKAQQHRVEADVLDADGTVLASAEYRNRTTPGGLRKLNLRADRDTLTALEEDLLLTVDPTDEFDNPIAGVAISWESDNPAILEAGPALPGQGRGRSKQNGQATVTARGTAGDTEIIETRLITVAQEAGPAGLTITGNTEVALGDVLLLTASGVDGNNRPITQFRWSIHPVVGDAEGGAEILGGTQGARLPTVQIRGTAVGLATARVTDPAGRAGREVIVRIVAVPQ